MHLNIIYIIQICKYRCIRILKMSNKRKKVSKSCVFCRRSHLICDEQRPCSRCIRRDIAHLCTDSLGSNGTGNAEFDMGNGIAANINEGPRMSSFLTQQPTFVSEHVGSEFSSLNEFLSMLEDPLLVNSSSSATNHENHSSENNNTTNNPALDVDHMESELDTATTSKEHFFLTAADPSTEITPEDRLKLVINAKLEAGLLQPYNYAQGYTRLQNYMDRYMNQSSKQRILKPLSTIRPAFRAIARSLKDVDLILVEEGFERMLLSYDRVFTSMSMPACLWRRTGEIYRANKEFANLVDCGVEDLIEGKLAIYELMTEESAVNFWEKYGSIAFDKGQKAVLTSCNLRTRDGRRKRPCCFSFTIRRDRYNIPICIVGNFIPIS
ncbi:hypothetical protein ZYGR_0AS02790 [Zygosaccharomyces rouxii]|uniref:Zn(2)-C6 fungal-type domain-containing protein n=1 Tax=Zygosaccharomyces rouxii TaxID=4956 RepID=A0A1Q3AGS3_ZYGRO|nr:hypothetical protein ZYGR_0AS02790 [Zygosaccharomyces rouxii]